MTSINRKASDELDALVKTAKRKAERVSDDVRDVATVAGTKAGRQIRHAGEKLIDAGRKIKKMTD
jgi:hypothetical protein